jgi:hypothetical protein
VARPQTAIDADIAAGVHPRDIRTHTRAVVYQTRETRAGRKRGWTEVQLYGGLLAENATQAVARDVLVAGLRSCDRAGWTVVGHVHDEAIVEADKGRDAADLKRAMLALPRWAAPALAAISGFPAYRSVRRRGIGPACGLGLASSGARPRRAERETCQQAAQWVFFGIAHGGHRRVWNRK